ncbi:MAG: ribbon-helix-helix protein, CopG family [Actinobacteria bacterium]|nr:ribbon-helix-helix protein, CopG family [Actinomycetota bacterium]
MNKKVMISMPSELLGEIDSAADEEHRSRSEVIREASRRYLIERSAKRRRPIDDPKIREALEVMDRLAKKIKPDWDSTKTIREMRDTR